MLVVRKTPNPLESPLIEREEEHEDYIKQASKQHEIEQVWLAWKAKADMILQRVSEENPKQNPLDIVKWLNSPDNSNMTLTYRNWRQIRRIFGDNFGELFEQDLLNYWKKINHRSGLAV